MSEFNQKRVIYTALARLLVAIPLFMVFLFLPAGTWNYWQAWSYMAVVFGVLFIVFAYLARWAPELLERRVKLQEKRDTQKKIVVIAMLVLLLAFCLPGLDRRFGWSQVPVWLVVAAQGAVLSGYLMIFRVMHVNHFASRVIEVADDQNLIDTDLYAWVRHPMYSGAIVFYVMTPLALGSFWAVIPALGMIPILAARIRDEERMLERDLPGYSAYKQKVRYRLLPGIW